MIRPEQEAEGARAPRLMSCLAAVLAGLLAANGAAAADSAAPSGADSAAPLALTVSESVLTALEQNVVFRLERLRPDIQREGEQIERAVFDPGVTAAVSYENLTGTDESDELAVEAGVNRFFPTGTTAEVRAGYTAMSENRVDTRSATWDVEVTQALLRDRRPAANLARLHQAQIDTRISEHELRGVAEALVATVETAYWDCVLAQDKIDIYLRSLEVAEQQIAEVREQVSIGKVAELELAAAEAEVAEKREELIAARGDLAKRLLVFRRVLAPEAGGQWWTRPLQLVDRPEPAARELKDVEAHVQLGLTKRPDLAQARLLVQRGELEVVATRNGLLPQLDMFVRLGGTHYSESFAAVIGEEDDYQVALGLALAFPMALREERARHRIAQLARRQQQSALANLEQLIQLDVRSAYVEVGVAREQILATGATRKLRGDTLTAEQEKFRVGTSTTLQVAQAWRDLLASQINEIEAVVTHRKALIHLFRLDGTLLERRGIDAR